MNWISESHFLEELHHNAVSNDLVKGRVLMTHMPDVSAETQRQVLTELGYFDASFAVPLLGYLLGSQLDELALSAEEIQMVMAEKVQQAPNLILDLIDDETILNKSKITELFDLIPPKLLVPGVLAKLEKTTSPEKLLVMIDLVSHMASPQMIGVLAEYIYSGNRELVFASIDALSHIGTQEAVQVLGHRAGADRELDVRIIKAFAQIKTDCALTQLVGYLAAPDAQTRNLAKSLLTQLGQRAVPLLVQNLESQQADILIHTLNVLGDIGIGDAIRPIRNLLHNEPEDANVRFAAYEALGVLPVEKGGYVLASGLTDLDGMVRVAAARAIEKNLDQTLLRGLENLTRSDDGDAARVVTALVDAPADQVLLHLIDEPHFFELVASYLANGAHPDTRTHIERLLQRNGRSEQAQHISRLGTGADTSKSLQIYAVDDSRMILSLYKKALYELGYEAVLFEFPESALEQIVEKKPDLVFTDLNMPGLTGLELTQEIRKFHDIQALPIVMVTTQSEGTDFAEAQKAGVSEIIHKPFDAEKLQRVIMQFTRS